MQKYPLTQNVCIYIFFLIPSLNNIAIKLGSKLNFYIADINLNHYINNGKF